MSLYDDLTTDVLAAEGNFVTEQLTNWFEHLDTTPWARTVVQRLQSDHDIKAFLDDDSNTTDGMGAELIWPKDRDKRLGLRVLLFREISEGRIDLGNFAINNTYVKGGVDVSVRKLLDQIFSPTCKELRRHLEAAAASAESVPASDRVVRLDHNSSRYKEITEALEGFEKAIRETNAAYNDPELREEHIAEVSAARRLLQPVRVNVSIVHALVIGVATFVATAFANEALGKLASSIIDKLNGWITSIITNAAPIPF